MLYLSDVVSSVKFFVLGSAVEMKLVVWLSQKNEDSA